LAVVWLSRVGYADDAAADVGRRADRECPVVIRLSKQLFDDLTRDEINTTMPVDRVVMGTRSVGTSEAKARVDIRLEPVQGQARFSLDVSGRITAATVALSRPVRVHCSSSSDFCGSATIEFDGLKFHVPDGQVTAEADVTVDQIATRRRGLLGRLIHRIAQREVEKRRPRAVALLERDTEAGVTEEFDLALDALEKKLQDVTPVEKTLHLVFPETRTWTYQLSTTSDYLQAGFGPTDSVIPPLPSRGDQPMRSAIELWVRAPAGFASLENLTSLWDSAQDVLAENLAEGEDAAPRVIKSAHVSRCEAWLVFDLHTASTKADFAVAGGSL
jgi:hypothetical protein